MSEENWFYLTAAKKGRKMESEIEREEGEKMEREETRSREREIWESGVATKCSPQVHVPRILLL